MSNAGILIESTSPCGRYSVVIDEDKSVCYAYLKYDGNMVSHVWIYNKGDAPDEPDWREREQDPPFKNSRDFVRPLDFALPESESSFSVKWFDGVIEGGLLVEIETDGVVVAEFMSGKRVGRSRLALRPNVLAVPLSDPRVEASKK